MSYGQDSLITSIDTFSYWHLSMDGVVVTAQYAPTHYSNAVHKVEVIKGVDIEKLGFSNLSEVLETRLGMGVSTDLQLGNSLSIRGIEGENIQVMIDGVPVIGRLEGNIDLSQIQVSNVLRIEVVKGPMSTIYGSNTTGGVINIITKQAQASRLEVSGTNRIEDLGIYENSLSAGLRFGSLLLQADARRYQNQLQPLDSLRVTELREYADGTTLRVKKYPWNPKLQWAANGSARYNFSDSLSFRYSYRYFTEDVQNYGEIRRPIFKPYAFDTYFNTKRLDHALHFKGYIGNRVFFSSTQAINTYHRISTNIRTDFEENKVTLLESEVDSTIFFSFLSRNVISYSSSLGLDFQAGFEWYQERARGKRFSDSDIDGQIINTAGWLSTKYLLFNQFTLMGNLRIGYNTVFRHPVLPSFQFMWKPTSSWTIRTGYSKGFRAPSLKELLFEFIDVNHYIIGNQELIAESSDTYTLQASSIFPLFNQAFSIDLDLFFNKMKNRITLAEYADLKYTYLNLEKFNSYGLELQFRYDFTQNITLGSGLGYTRLSNLYDIEEELNYHDLFEWENSLRFYWSYFKTTISATQKLTGKQVIYSINDKDELVEDFIEGMNMLNLAISKPFFKDQIQLSIGVKNLLNLQSINISRGINASQIHSTTGASRVVHWGRSYFIGLNFHFQ